MDLIDLIDELIRYADPEKSAFARLVRLRQKVLSNVMLMPRDMRFLQHLRDLQSNIECKNLADSGGCRIPGKKYCEHTQLFKKCSYYVQQRGTNDINPLSGLIRR